MIGWTLAAAADPGQEAVELAERMVDAIGPRSALSPAGAAAQEWVGAELERAGWHPRTRYFGNYPTTWSCRQGQRADVILFLAHTDTIDDQTLGLLDNASGVATLLVAARQIPVRPRRTVCFAFPDANGLGRVGSTAFAAAGARGFLGPIDQVVAVDEVGSSATIHAGLGPSMSYGALRETLRVAPAPAPWLWRAASVAGFDRLTSDEYGFSAHGIPASRLTSRPSSSHEGLDPAAMTRAVRLVRHLARARPLPQPSFVNGDGALPTPGGFVVPGWTVLCTIVAGSLAAAHRVRLANQTTLVALIGGLLASFAFFVATAAEEGGPSTWALVAGWSAWGGVLWLWPWPPSRQGGAALAIWPAGFGVFVAWQWGALFAWPLGLSAMAIALGAGRPGWPAWFAMATLPAIIIANPTALADAAIHGWANRPSEWGVAHAIGAAGAAGLLQRRVLPRGKIRWLPGLLMLVAAIVAATINALQ